MNCTKCGKEIPDGENKVCDECQAKVLEEIANEEKSDVNNQEKTQKSEKGSNKGFLVVIACVIIAIVALLIVFIINNTNANEGNSIGNIRNYGYGTVSGNWIYYLAPNEDSSNVGIFKVKKDGSDKQQIFMNEGSNDQEIVSINVSGKYVYFIKIIQEAYNEDDQLDNKIYRMKIDGSDLQVINDNEINNDCYEIYVIDGAVYYIDTNANVAKMNLDGSNKSVVSENGTGYIGITKDYIIYNDLKDENSEEYVTYIMDINGQNQRPILQDKRLYSVNVENDYIYYTSEEKQICRTKIDSGEEEIISETEAYNLNVNNGYAYFYNYLDAENDDLTVGLFRVNVESFGENNEPEKIKELESYSSFLNIVDDFILYMDSNDTAGFINLLKKDGSGDPIQLYYLNYEELYNSIPNIDETTPEDITDGETSTEDTTPTNEQSSEVTPETPTNPEINNV